MSASRPQKTQGPTVRRWATKSEIAAAKGISLRKLESLMKQGLPHYKIERRVAICPEVVDEWFDKHFRVN